MRRCISEPTIRFPRPAPRSVATSAFTTPGALIRALTGRRQTMLTSLACRTSRQTEPGRRSTYQNRNAVQTNRATPDTCGEPDGRIRNTIERLRTFPHLLRVSEAVLVEKSDLIERLPLLSRQVRRWGSPGKSRCINVGRNRTRHIGVDAQQA